MIEIDIDIDDPETVGLWETVADLVPHLPGEWVLIGGLMVQLHALEHGVTDVRPTDDIDVLGQARPQGTLGAIHAALEQQDFQMVGPDLDGYAHRYERNGLIVDVLGPDGIHPPVPLAPGLNAVSAPGGTQALHRSESVTIQVQGHSLELRRPTLLGAILIKARSLMVHEDPETQREDLLRLLALVEDPREMATGLRKTERRWLRESKERLRPTEISALDTSSRVRSEQAYRLLVGD